MSKENGLLESMVLVQQNENKKLEKSKTQEAYELLGLDFKEEEELDITDLTKSESAAMEKKVGTVMDEYKSGKLKSGSGEKVTDKKQAMAIALNEAKKVKNELRKGLDTSGSQSGSLDPKMKTFMKSYMESDEGAKMMKACGFMKKADMDEYMKGYMKGKK